MPGIPGIHQVTQMDLMTVLNQVIHQVIQMVTRTE